MAQHPPFQRFCCAHNRHGEDASIWDDSLSCWKGIDILVEITSEGQTHNSGAERSTLKLLIQKAVQQAVAEGETQVAKELNDILRDCAMT